MPSTTVSERRLSFVGDIVEAIGSICHPWALDSIAMIQDMTSKDFALKEMMFQEVRDLLGNLAMKT